MSNSLTDNNNNFFLYINRSFTALPVPKPL